MTAGNSISAYRLNRPKWTAVMDALGKRRGSDDEKLSDENLQALHDLLLLNLLGVREEMGRRGMQSSVAIYSASTAWQGEAAP
jgi:hypothetical protein